MKDRWMVRIALLFICLFSSLYAAPQITGKVLIAGICKNIESVLPTTIVSMETLGTLFEDHEIFVYENNSSDQTPQILQKWAEKNPKVHLTTEIVDQETLSQTCFNLCPSGQFFYAEQIARARNIVLDQIMDPLYDDFDYVIWLDMDFNHLLPFDEIVKTFSRQDWDAVFANGLNGNKTAHFDLFAFRDDRQPFGPELFGDLWWKFGGWDSKEAWTTYIQGRIPYRSFLKMWRPHTMFFHPGSPWHPVYSAFGGMGIYKRDSIKGCRYSATVTGELEIWVEEMIQKGVRERNPNILLYLILSNEAHPIIRLPELRANLPHCTDPNCGIILSSSGVIWRMNTKCSQYPTICEHVTFHASMMNRGHDKLFINPNLILYYDER